MKIKFFDYTLLATVLLLTTFTAYMRIQGTLIGYRIGELKDKESLLIDEVSSLKMKLAKLTSKGNLTILASKDATNNDPFEAFVSIEKDRKEKADRTLYEATAPQ